VGERVAGGAGQIGEKEGKKQKRKKYEMSLAFDEKSSILYGYNFFPTVGNLLTFLIL